MLVECVWEHNGSDSLLYAVDYPGAYTRGAGIDEAIQKMEREICTYQMWKNEPVTGLIEVLIVEDVESSLAIRDADSDVLFTAEKRPLSLDAYQDLKSLALKSARDFLRLYESVPDRRISSVKPRKTFYGSVPRTAQEMYTHTKNVNTYYFSEIGVDADNDGDIVVCRENGFRKLEEQQNYLLNRVYSGSYGELWTLRKMLRRFIWHDRIHAKAMYRMAIRTFGEASVPDIFGFEGLGG